MSETKKEYKEIEFVAGDTIEECVEELLKHKENGELVFGVFNGHKLYSDTITLDSAFKEITGKSQKEWDESIKKAREEMEEQRKKYEESIPEFITFWVEKGKEILDEDKWELWEKVVPIRLNDLYQGTELGCCLEIIKILNNNGTLDEAKEEIENQGHSGMSYSLVRAMVRDLCVRGKEFSNYAKY